MVQITALLLACTIATGPGVEAARSHRDANGTAILTEFSRFLKLPNVASDAEGIRRNARWLAGAFERRGIEMQVLTIDGAPPIVIGEIPRPGATATIGIYAHYDGQPVDEDRWSTPPWTPTLYTAPIDEGGEPRALPAPGTPIDPEWRLYGRAAADDKAPLIALMAAIDALAAADLVPTTRIRFLFEGEEEAGSPNLREYMRRFRDRLTADVWLICDGPVHQSRRPQIVFGVRGVVEAEITVYGANRYLHSGHYGNWAPNPALMLAELLASMKDDAGRVTVEGFYEDVEPLSPRERAALRRVPDVDEDLRRQFGLAGTEMRDLTLRESLLLPSLNVRGVLSGAVGDKARNSIPSSATASLDIRLVKGNDPARMLDRLESHIRGQGYTIVRGTPDEQTRLSHPRLARVTRGTGYRAARTPMDLPVVASLVEAVRAASGEQDIIQMPSLGGSLPLYLFEEMLGAPVIILPIANHDNNQHGPDENLRLANLFYGIDLMAALLTMEPPASPPTE